MQVLARSPEVCLGAEVGDVDDQRITFPAAARVPPPEADRRREMRCSVHGDGTMPSLALACVIENRNRSRRLHNLAEATEIRQDRRQTTLRQATVLRSVRAIDGAAAATWANIDRVVERNRLRSPWRRWSVRAADAAGRLV